MRQINKEEIRATAMKEHKNFWDKNAGRYDRFMRKDRAAYEEMYTLIRPVVKAKTVLELATGTGLIAKHIVNAAAHIEATDASAEMIAKAKRDNQSVKLHFSVQDMFRLPYANQSFDVVIVSNALHIVPQPEKALQEIKRVLKDDGVLIAPTFTHAGNSFSFCPLPYQKRKHTSRAKTTAPIIRGRIHCFSFFCTVCSGPFSAAGAAGAGAGSSSLLSSSRYSSGTL